MIATDDRQVERDAGSKKIAGFFSPWPEGSPGVGLVAERGQEGRGRGHCDCKRYRARIESRRHPPPRARSAAPPRRPAPTAKAAAISRTTSRSIALRASLTESTRAATMIPAASSASWTIGSTSKAARTITTAATAPTSGALRVAEDGAPPSRAIRRSHDPRCQRSFNRRPTSRSRAAKRPSPSCGPTPARSSIRGWSTP